MKYPIVFILILVILASCRKDPELMEVPKNGVTPYVLDIPFGFPPMQIPADNPMTVEGVELGRHLFYEEMLSGDNTQSCASCHAPSLAFSDDTPLSEGIDGNDGKRNAMPLFNLGWSPTLFWDGRSATLEEQAFEPVINPVEMHETWPNAVAKLQASSVYPNMFLDAFGTSVIDSALVIKALAQFERTLISGNSKFDKYRRGELNLSNDEFAGYVVFQTMGEGDCLHCHTDPIAGGLTTDFSFRNNGLDLTPLDSGRMHVTGNSNDFAKFKVPSLRNLTFTAPFMHDGRFNTLDEVLDFYILDVQNSTTVDGLMFEPDNDINGYLGMNLNNLQKANLKKFLLTLVDSSFVMNPAFQDPN